MPDQPSLTDKISALAPPNLGGHLSPVRFMIARMAEDQITRVAASLSFTTTLAVVPALALMLALLTAFPAFESVRTSVQDFIIGNFILDTGLKMKEQLASFVEAAAKLTVFGVIGLVVTSIMLLLTIESSFNQIFKVSRPRPMLMRLLVLWAVITVGPFLIGTSFTLFGYFGVAQFLATPGVAESVGLLLGQLAPTLLAWIAITFIYLVVPNRRVALKDALIGAGVAAFLFGLLRYGFAAYVASMTSYEAVYGAVAAVPIFLFWVYLSWIVVMAGAVITATLPDWRYVKAGGLGTVMAQVALALDIIAKLGAAQRAGHARTTRALAKALTVPDVALTRVLEVLRAGRFVATTEDGGWMLSRDLERTALADLAHLFGLGLDGTALPADRAGSDVAKRLYVHLGRAAESERTLLSVSLAKIVALPDEAPQAGSAVGSSAQDV
ncbi:MAG: YihY family inner membrane protein [Rhodospirillaceae bacterium]|nr:YihY family inner membrane protein [Rhodospirillaceae bacterium]